MATALTVQEALAGWDLELRQPAGLMQAPRYLLERHAQALWNEIMANEEAAREVVLAYEGIKTELRLRQLARHTKHLPLNGRV